MTNDRKLSVLEVVLLSAIADLYVIAEASCKDENGNRSEHEARTLEQAKQAIDYARRGLKPSKGGK